MVRFESDWTNTSGGEAWRERNEKTARFGCEISDISAYCVPERNFCLKEIGEFSWQSP
jgi:hypothetical protein